MAHLLECALTTGPPLVLPLSGARGPRPASGAAVDGAHEKLIDDVAYEVARYGNSQLHAVGAVLGGIASQELIKIITGQYAPMTKRLIFIP